MIIFPISSKSLILFEIVDPRFCYSASRRKNRDKFFFVLLFRSFTVSVRSLARRRMRRRGGKFFVLSNSKRKGRDSARRSARSPLVVGRGNKLESIMDDTVFVQLCERCFELLFFFFLFLMSFSALHKILDTSIIRFNFLIFSISSGVPSFLANSAF